MLLFITGLDNCFLLAGQMAEKFASIVSTKSMGAVMEKSSDNLKKAVKSKTGPLQNSLLISGKCRYYTERGHPSFLNKS